MVRTAVKTKCPQCEHVFLPTKEEVQSRAGRSARTKGHAFERRVAAALQKWWPGNHEFKRTPMSGGSVLKVGWDMAGDICTTAPDFKFHIECKNTNSWDGFHQALTADKFKLWEWLDQAMFDCPDGKETLIICTRTGHPNYVVGLGIHVKRLLTLTQLQYIQLPEYVLKGVEGVTREVYVWLFDDMLKTNPSIWTPAMWTAP